MEQAREKLREIYQFMSFQQRQRVDEIIDEEVNAMKLYPCSQENLFLQYHNLLDSVMVRIKKMHFQGKIPIELIISIKMQIISKLCELFNQITNSILQLILQYKTIIIKSGNMDFLYHSFQNLGGYLSIKNFQNFHLKKMGLKKMSISLDYVLKEYAQILKIHFGETHISFLDGVISEIIKQFDVIFEKAQLQVEKCPSYKMEVFDGKSKTNKKQIEAKYATLIGQQRQIQSKLNPQNKPKSQIKQLKQQQQPKQSTTKSLANLVVGAAQIVQSPFKMISKTMIDYLVPQKKYEQKHLSMIFQKEHSNIYFNQNLKNCTEIPSKIYHLCIKLIQKEITIGIEDFHYTFSAPEKQYIAVSLNLELQVQRQNSKGILSEETSLSQKNNLYINQCFQYVVSLFQQIKFIEGNKMGKYCVQEFNIVKFCFYLYSQIKKHFGWKSINKIYLKWVCRYLGKFFLTENHNYMEQVLNIFESEGQQDQISDFRSTLYTKKIKQGFPLEGDLKNIYKKMPSLPVPPQKLVLYNLSTSSPRKTITLLISGFLSEDCDKQNQWKGILEDLKHAQIYALNWQSCSRQDFCQYGLRFAKNMFTGNGYAKMLNVGGVIGKIVGAVASVGMEYRSNPFAAAEEKAKITGIYLAQLLMLNFGNNFINLVGFSLGTQVVASCVSHLIEKKSTHLINRIVTMGGVADKNNIKQLLQNCQSMLRWCNLHSKNDWALYYGYKLHSPLRQVIGLKGIPEVVGHEIQNMDASDFIDGHMKYRQKLLVISKMIGLRND